MWKLIKRVGPGLARGKFKGVFIGKRLRKVRIYCELLIRPKEDLKLYYGLQVTFPEWNALLELVQKICIGFV